MSQTHKSTHAPCIICFQSHALDHSCKHIKVVACKSCYKMNVHTSQCNCTRRNQKEPPQTIRLVGESNGPRWYFDVTIYEKSFPALINSTIIRNSINYNMSVWIQANSYATINTDLTEISVAFNIKGALVSMMCDIRKYQVENIELGSEFLKYIGYKFVFDGVTIDSKKSVIVSNPYEIDYVYNLPSIGKDLRHYLNLKRSFLRKGRITKLSNWPSLIKDGHIVQSALPHVKIN